MVTVTEYASKNVMIRTPCNRVSLTEDDQRVVLVWFWKNKPEMLRDIVCENCPEVH